VRIDIADDTAAFEDADPLRRRMALGAGWPDLISGAGFPGFAGGLANQATSHYEVLVGNVRAHA